MRVSLLPDFASTSSPRRRRSTFSAANIWRRKPDDGRASQRRAQVHSQVGALAAASLCCQHEHASKNAPHLSRRSGGVSARCAGAVGREKARALRGGRVRGRVPARCRLDLAGLAKLEQARRIALANEGLMRSCDLLIANLTPFRGVSMDAGTAFEVGFMRALGQPVLGYTNVVGRLSARGPRRSAARGIPAGDADRPMRDRGFRSGREPDDRDRYPRIGRPRRSAMPLRWRCDDRPCRLRALPRRSAPARPPPQYASGS